MKTSEKAAQNVEKLKAEYNELGVKIQSIETERKKENANYKQTVDSLKDMKAAEEKRKK